jgi:hypothetical protein
MWLVACSKIPWFRHPILYAKCRGVAEGATLVMATDIDIAIVKGHMKTLTSSLTECDRYKNVYNNGMGFTITGNFKEFGRFQDDED